MGRDHSRSACLSVIGWFWFRAPTFAAAWNPQRPDRGRRHGLEHRAHPVGLPGHGIGRRRTPMRSRTRSRTSPSPACSGRCGAGGHLHPVHDRHPGHRAERRARGLHRTVRVSSTRRCSARPSARSSWPWRCWPASARCSAGSSRSAMTAKTAADERHVPARSSPAVNAHGAPVVGMIVHGDRAVRCWRCRPSRPSLSEQFGSARQPRRRRRNVIPYFMALSALPLMMRTAGVNNVKYGRDVAVAAVAILVQRVCDLRVRQGRRAGGHWWCGRSAT